MIDYEKIICTGIMLEALTIRQALNYLPLTVIDQLKDNLSIFTMTNKAGVRLSRPLCQANDIIFLSDKIFPPEETPQTETNFRFFIIVLLHELVHAYLKHKCRVFHGISPDEVDKQELEADAMAMQWYNEYVEAHAELEIAAITKEEMDAFRTNFSSNRSTI
jgi:hypothetical protein